MKKSIAKKWIAALRSGRYKQCRRRLRSRDNKFCCLGVLCDIYDKENPKAISAFQTGFNVLPYSVLEWSGMWNWRGAIPGSNESLVCENDTFKESFETIADIIEDNWGAL